MKKLIAIGIITGLAIAAIPGTNSLISVLNADESIGNTSVVIGEQTARNLVDFNNGFYAGEIVHPSVSDNAELNPQTARNAVDYWNGDYFGSVPGQQ